MASKEHNSLKSELTAIEMLIRRFNRKAELTIDQVIIEEDITNLLKKNDLIAMTDISKTLQDIQEDLVNDQEFIKKELKDISNKIKNLKERNPTQAENIKTLSKKFKLLQTQFEKGSGVAKSRDIASKIEIIENAKNTGYHKRQELLGAVLRNDAPYAKLLLAEGVSVNLKLKNTQTLFDIAKEHPTHEILDILNNFKNFYDQKNDFYKQLEKETKILDKLLSNTKNNPMQEGALLHKKQNLNSFIEKANELFKNATPLAHEKPKEVSQAISHLSLELSRLEISPANDKEIAEETHTRSRRP